MKSYSFVMLAILVFCSECSLVESFRSLNFGVKLHQNGLVCRTQRNPTISKSSALISMSINEGNDISNGDYGLGGDDVLSHATSTTSRSAQMQGTEEFAGPGTWVLESEVECDVSVAFVSTRNCIWAENALEFLLVASSTHAF
jgi:hypothetical protein